MSTKIHATPVPSSARLLPYVVQHEVNSYVHTALPLCVALAAGGEGWLANRFVNLHSYCLTARPDTHHLGYTDAFAFLAACDPRILSTEQAFELESGVGYLVASIQAGRPAILFVEDAVMVGLPRRRIREYLFTGYADGRLHAVGFDEERHFSEMVVDPDHVERAFQAGLETISSRPDLAPTTAMGMTLGAWSGSEEFDETRVLGEISAYSRAVRPEGFDPTAGWWWFDRRLDLAEDAPVRYGVDVYLGVRDQVEEHLANASWPNFPMFHLLREHKILLRRTLDRLVGWDPAAAGALAECDQIARALDRLRIKVLMTQERASGTSLSTADAELLTTLRPRESDALKEILAIAEPKPAPKPKPKNQG